MTSVILGLLLMLPQTVVNAGPTDYSISILIHERMGFDTEVIVTSKPIPDGPQVSNPFSATTQPTHRWMTTKTVIGKTTPFGLIIMGQGVTLEDAFNDLKKNHPYLFP